MGKQKGEASRTKDRSSSSSLAASLLPPAATSPGFGGYTGSSRIDSSVLTDEGSPFMNIDSEIMQHLIRLSRKDATTKHKALISLSVLFKQKSGRDIVPIIPHWAFEYRKLLVDYNREVRRATQDTLISLVTSVGRNLAPHLKSLMGPWWFSLFDPVFEVSLAAKRSLQVAFPAPEKRLEALIFCTTEIFTYLEENLKLTPHIISDKAASYELKEIHDWVLSSSLLALGTLIDILVCMHSETLDIKIIIAEQKLVSKARATAVAFSEKLFSSHNFFIGFLKSRSPSIRSATFSVLRSFIKNIPNAFNIGNSKTIAAAVLGAFQEKDPSCHLAMWDTILLFSNMYPCSWASVNIQKTVLSKFLIFLRSGCFGSQLVSYPFLVRFLETVPPDAIMGDKFLLEFFQNLWAGRNSSISLNAERSVYFVAVKDCFLWVLCNASRYCNRADSVNKFQVALINNILIKVLWHDYLLCVNSNAHTSVSSEELTDSSASSDVSLFNKEIETLKNTITMTPLHDLAKCIIEILSGIYSLNRYLLSDFCMSFEKNFLDLCSRVTTENFFWNAERIVMFLSLLDQHAVQKGESWPLVCLVGPMFSKSFQLIRSHGTLDALRLLSVVISIFGPQKIIREFFINDEGCPCNHLMHCDHKLQQDKFLQVYKDVFVPWCLDGNSCSTSARLDFMLELLDNDCFTEQWSIIITYATKLIDLAIFTNSENMEMLSTIMQKLREKHRKGRIEAGSNSHQCSWPELWQHKFLDSLAVSVICSHSFSSSSNARFMRAALGCSMEDNQTPFLSKNAMFLVFAEILKKLYGFIMKSPFTSVRNAGSLLISGANISISEFESVATMLEMVPLALNVLDNGFFCLEKFGTESWLVSRISAAVFIMGYEYCLTAVLCDANDVVSKSHLEPRLDFGKSMHELHSRISKHFWNKIGTVYREWLGKMLVHFVRTVIFEGDKQKNDKITSLCCRWILNILECLCQNQHEEQRLLDEFLSEDDHWPLWVIPNLGFGKRSASLKVNKIVTAVHVSENFEFVALIDKLIYELGFDRLIVSFEIGSPCLIEEPAENLFTSYVGYSRAWLAAEILCTWEWDGGSVLCTFLPLLRNSVKTLSTGSLLDSIINILMDGALVQSSCGKMNFLNLWTTPFVEIGSVEEPYLRALCVLLLALFKDHIWDREKAGKLFQSLVHKLSFGDEINTNCLQILPSIVNILAQPLGRDGSGESGSDGEPSSFAQHLHNWLQKCILLPNLLSWKNGQDLEWYQLVISCYLLCESGVETIKLAKYIYPEEKNLLLKLFRNQRCGTDAAAATDHLPSAHVLLSKLIAISVQYCYKEFNEQDWEFVISQLRRMIESAVVIMEEVAENVNDALTHSSTLDNMEDILEKISRIVLSLNPFFIDTARYALLAFSLFCDFTESHQTDDPDKLSLLKMERWDLIKDRIYESVLRLFFSIGVVDSIIYSNCAEASSIISWEYFSHSHFWELVASIVVKSSARARDRAVKSFEFWGLSKGSITSLYAILFSSNPFPSMQFAAYFILSSEPLSSLAIIGESSHYRLDPTGDSDSSTIDMSSNGDVQLREELLSIIEQVPFEPIEAVAMSQEHVHIFLGWSLLLSHISSLPSSQPERKKLVQYIQDSINPAILDILFYHIPLESCLENCLKNKDMILSSGLTEATTSATRSIKTGSLLFAVEMLLKEEKITSLSGAIFGLLLCVLPSYVREWFSNLHDHSTSSMVKTFTKHWCSPPLIADELSQIKKVEFLDETFVISVSKSASEVVATYKKEETGMDLVIRLPQSYPLRPVDVYCTRSLGISEVKKRKWLMSLTAFVRNQNGALGEAIRIWKSNFDKEFHGVEECPICYSVIHTANHSLPKLVCRTCKHKFHSPCLYKWFSTSNKSICPLCQSPF